MRRRDYTANLALAWAVATTPGCVIECGVWEGGSSARHGGDPRVRPRVLPFDSFEGHTTPQPVDGPAAFEWQADKSGPWYFDNAVVGPEVADAAMKRSGARNYHLVKGWFEDTLANFTPPSQIAVLRIDCDWHAGTMTCLQALFPHLADDGIFIADGYPDWDGTRRPSTNTWPPTTASTRIKELDGLYYVVKGARKWEFDE